MLASPASVVRVTLSRSVGICRKSLVAKRSLSINNDGYEVPQENIDEFHEKGYTVLPDFLTEEELMPLEEIYWKFLEREIHVPGKDFCDMSATYEKTFEEFSIVNCMLPRVYHPELQGNIYELRASSVCHQLFGMEMVLDYDQLLNKRPSKEDAIFAWHQDMAYWPKTPDTRTATFSLAFDATTPENGAIKFVPGSHNEPEIRPHVPIGESRDEAHAIAAIVDERNESNPDGKDVVEYACVPRGGISIHNELVVHGSGGNYTDGNRRTYVIAYRTPETVALEREAGFTHSHNDEINWDTFNKWQEKSEAE